MVGGRWYACDFIHSSFYFSFLFGSQSRCPEDERKNKGEEREKKKRKRGRLSLIISFFLPSLLPPSGPSFPSARAPPFPAGPPLRCPAGGKVKLSTVTLYAKSVRIFPLIARGSCGVSERDLDAAGLTVMHANVVRSTAFYGTKRPGIFVGFVE